MKKTLLALLGILLISACQEKDTTFLITEQSVGPLQTTTIVDNLETIFVNDSLVKDTVAFQFGSSAGKIKVFEKGGKHLLTLTPSQDSVQTVENIQVFDPRYLSATGIGLQSTFGDIKANYEVKKIVTTMNSLVVFPKESNLYFTLYKEDLPENLRYTTSRIEMVQIPDDARIKYLMLGWNP